MRNIFHNILIISLILSLTAAPAIVSAMPSPTPATQTDKQKAAAQKQKEKEKAAAQKQKEKEKAQKAKEKEQAAKAKEKEQAAKAKEKEQAARAKEKEKADKEKAKAAEERAKQQAEREAAKAQKEAEAKEKEEKAIRDYEKYQADLANPKTEVVSFFNVGLRAGYSALMDKIQPNADGTLWGAGTLNQNNALQQLKGGGGVGLDFTYNLSYDYFLFETGLDFRFLNSTSNYGFQAMRTDNTYAGAQYSYLFDNLRETRNIMQIGLPIMFGAQYNIMYFLAGVKVGYTFFGKYKQSGQYDITVNDPGLLEPYGMGIHELNGQTNQPIKFAQPELSLAAEIGINLDDWLQAQPDPKKKVKVKPGERLPFGREHIHYRVGLFAEYGVLNTNATPAANPVEFANNDALVQRTNTMLAMNGNTKLNNLFVGARFAIRFEVPGRQARNVPPPASYAIYSVVDEVTEQPLQIAFVETRGAETGKIAMRSKQISPKGFKQRHAVGSFIAEASADGYFPAKQEFTIEKVGSTQYVTIALKPCPTFRVRVTNMETGQVLPATVEIIQTGVEQPAYSLQTDSINGSARQVLTEGPQYSLRIAQMGYEAVELPIAHVGDSMNVALKPIKKGEKFVVKNLFFATNKTRILARSEEALNSLFMYLDRNPQVRIKIIGHTDNVGKDAANQKLSDGRANAVMQDLIERGIAPERLEAEGRGETQPIDTNDTEEGRQNNRRVEIEIL